MRTERLKSLVDSGRYTPDPGAIADAMLRRHGVRTLLTTGVELRQADQSRRAPATARRAA